MNKKVSTIFAMAALAGGVFCGSAYAQSPTAVLSGDKLTSYTSGSVMLANDVTTPDYLSYIAGTSGNPSTAITNQEGASVAKDVMLNNTWNVRVIGGDDTRKYNHYIFTNAVTGDTLSFVKGGPNAGQLLIQDKTGSTKIWAADGAYTFAFENTTPALVNYGAGMTLKTVASDVLDTDGDGTADAAGYVNISGGSASLVATGAPVIAMYKLNTMNADILELNALYNGKGFNLGVRPVLTNNDEIGGNLFDSEETTIWAFEVEPSVIPAANRKTDGAGNVIGYILPANQTSSGNELYVPNGVYFFTNPVFKNGKSAANYVAGTLTADDINWLNSTLIALSPTETLEATDANRADGEGFGLITEQGTNFIFASNTSNPQGDDLFISNACFTVTTNFSSTYPYAISLNTFYYQETATYSGTTDQTSASIHLGVSSYGNTRQSLVSKIGSTEHIFTLKASSVVDGKDLLHTSKQAAIYTIKFVSGSTNLNDKYLTVGKAGGSSFQWEAKGAAIAEEDFPIFQFVITKVDENTNEVTFTNRETGEDLTTQLFRENGTNRYSMSVNFPVVPYTVTTASANTYEVEAQNAVNYNPNIIVELNRLDNVDQYAGFLNIDNESIRTLAFARDKNDTSNKFYTIVGDENGDGDLNLSYDYNLTNNDNFVDDITGAAQWQVLKITSTSISRVYVYNNTETESIDDVPNGDKVTAYVYALRYVDDGTETDWFLNNTYGSKPYDLEEISNIDAASDLNVTRYNGVKFIIKENVDGSVSLIERSNAFNAGVVADADVEKAIDARINPRTGVREYTFNENVYQSAIQANNVKAYLDEQPVDISWPAQEGHVTILSDLGNYITMNEDRDGIVVNENEADTYYLYVTDEDAIVPSFYITRGTGATDGERMYMFNPTDSVDYYVANGDYDRVYEWSVDHMKVMFKAATINETRDTLTMDVKGETKYIAEDADNNNRDIWGGINRFKWQIIEATDADGYYRIRQANAETGEGNYLSAWNDRLTWSDREGALLFTIEGAAAPTANEGVSATEVKIIATDGAINVKNAAGKNVVVSTILGQIVANEVLTSDNATISVPAGIVIVSVDGEEAVKVNVK